MLFILYIYLLQESNLQSSRELDFKSSASTNSAKQAYNLWARGFEPLSFAWKANILTIELHPHCIYEILATGLEPAILIQELVPKTNVFTNFTTPTDKKITLYLI